MGSPCQSSPRGAGPHGHGVAWVRRGVPSPQPWQGGAQGGAKLGAWGSQRIARDPQLTIEDVKLICGVAKSCKRESPGQSPCLGTRDPPALHPRDTVGHSPVLAPCILIPGVATARGQTPHVALPWVTWGRKLLKPVWMCLPLPTPEGLDPRPCCQAPPGHSPRRRGPLPPGNCVPPTVLGEVVGHVFVQAHSPDTLLELLRDSVTDPAGPSCVGRETLSPAASSAPKPPRAPHGKAWGQGVFQLRGADYQLPPHPPAAFGDKTLHLRDALPRAQHGFPTPLPPLSLICHASPSTDPP